MNLQEFIKVTQNQINVEKQEEKWPFPSFFIWNGGGGCTHVFFITVWCVYTCERGCLYIIIYETKKREKKGFMIYCIYKQWRMVEPVFVIILIMLLSLADWVQSQKSMPEFCKI